MPAVLHTRLELACLSLCALLAGATTARADELIDFNRQIRPLLSNNCYACHGPDEAARQAGLRLDQRTSALAALESGAVAIVPGNREQSEVVRRILSDDKDQQMPPPESTKQLTPDQAALIARWIDQGAKWADHWAFVKPVRPALPEISAAKYQVINPIDAFVAQRLEREQLPMSTEATRHILIRRVSLDLTGLPPTPAEVDAFVGDAAPDAYEKLVERSLSSPHYGERMAMPWLDLARYADSDGYHDDTPRIIHPFRDYVIASFNANKPFDQFTVEQLAGDLLPEATLEQKIASAFHRLGPTSSEGGADAAEYAAKYAVDRVNTTATVWLGLTINCSECHDHKFDPLLNKEFYSLFAFFNQVPEQPLFRGSNAPPTIRVPNAAQQSKLAEMDAQIKSLNDQVASQVAVGASADPALNEQLSAATKARGEFEATIPELRVMADAPERRPTHILVRGDYRNSGEEVQPGVPAVLGSLPNDAPVNRLALARWLTDPDHPLTARVTVNRFWQLFFGGGLVKTAEDFGVQGERPSHPELLDWLACEFIERGWDVKHIVRLIVTSAAYRQSSAASPELLRRDPENRLLARGPHGRLAGELVRDNALAISGLLVREIGGPSVKPYQPGDLWREFGYGDSADKSYIQDHGPNLYRRGLYTFWKRSVLYPAFATFDAPKREVCTARRSTTNTPLQALVTLNDATYVEAARVFAQRVMQEAGGEGDARIQHAFRLALARPASQVELQAMRLLYEDTLAIYQKDAAAAERLVSVGESPRPGLDVADHAAWTCVCNAILNLDETITKD